ncbi:NADPH-dependent FMN reductase [Desulfonema limicola]|uniref:NADPH-dependent FMN reductase n=1 Tax=Desulfonema limicola TaxID=45656 RepID=A0A975GFD9_9BACT|nr:NAD(P)H-dependent oxidoreductase [Desulfonema limicola]QTA79138.1 NADPH-dependent FMN reductase [Desulfonema limicola]
MLVLGLQGSPRKKSNTDFLLSAFMKEAEKYGAKTHVVDVCSKNIQPCKEFTTCEKKGFCPIKDDMDPEIYPLLRQADVVVPASPVFFYNVTAQLKALIDRTQTLWARRYRLNLTDPKRNIRRGFMLSQGATKGKNLFLGIDLTAKYFFDAVGASFDGSLYYWRIENRGDMEKHPTVIKDIEKAVKKLLTPLADRKKVLFACRENACRSQMAGAFAQYLAGDKLDVITGGSAPAQHINPMMKTVMAEKGIDMEFITPRSIDQAIEQVKPELIVTMGCGEECPFVPGAEKLDWELPDPAGRDIEFMRETRDKIEQEIKDMLRKI